MVLTLFDPGSSAQSVGSKEDTHACENLGFRSAGDASEVAVGNGYDGCGQVVSRDSVKLM